MAVALVCAVASCKQGQGERCQLDSDCESGLKCVTGASQSVPPEGQCEPSGFTTQDAGPDTAPQQDAQADVQADTAVQQDAAPDAPAGDAAADAATD